MTKTQIVSYEMLQTLKQNINTCIYFIYNMFTYNNNNKLT